MPQVITELAVVALIGMAASAANTTGPLSAMQISRSTLPTALVAQVTPPTRPAFSGIWTMDKDRSEAAAQEQPIGEVVVAITLTGSMLNIETTRNGKAELATYPLGYQPSVTTEESGERRAFWNGSVLIDEGSVNVSGQTVAFREARTLAGDGGEMVVETTIKIEHGYELNGTQTVVTGKDVYVRRH